jgi:hypothetical protein
VAEAAAPGPAAAVETAPRATVRTSVRERQAGALRRLAELSALTAFAIVQPVLDVTGRAPDFFLYRRPSLWQIRLLVLAIVIGPAIGMWLAELVVGLVSNAAARVLHLAFLATLFGIVAIEIGKHAHLFVGVPLAILGALVGVGLAVLAARSVGLRQAMLYAAPAPLVFALLFVVTTPSGDLVRAAGTKKIDVVAHAPNKPPIVFIFLDEFPQRALLDANGQIDATLFPNFARLAKLTTWYPNATGVSGWTPFAAPAMLSGRYPRKVLAPVYRAYPQNLFTLLDGTYKVRGFETISQLCPPSVCTDVPTGRPVGLKAMAHDTAHIAKQIVWPYHAKGDITQQYQETATVDTPPVEDPKQLPGVQALFDNAALNQPNRLTEFLKGLKPEPQPTLHFLHLLLPHAPWRYLPSANQYVPPAPAFVPPRPGIDDVQRKHLSMDPVLSVLGKERLLLQTAYTDTLIGTLLDSMQHSGLLDKSLLIVTADHGTGMTPGAKARQMDAQNPADLDWVPLFVKAPGAKGGNVDQRNEQQVDLMPTIADVLGITIPWHVDGVSMLGPARTTDDKLWYDIPGIAQHIDVGKWRPLVKKGLAAEVALPTKGRDGLYDVGPLKGLVDKPLSALTVGSGAGVGARLDKKVDIEKVGATAGLLPSMLFGTFDHPPARESTWLVASVNGTIAGVVAAVPGGDGVWRFLGVVRDKYFVPGHNDVRLYTVTGGTTLHPVAWQ